MKNYDESVKINHKPNCPYIHDHSYRILTIGGSGLGKTNVTELNKTSTMRCWQNLLVRQRSTQIKVSMVEKK